MPMRDFFQVFPKLADSELRTVTLGRGARSAAPADLYAFLELYCDEPGCDCRRVTIVVISDRKRAPVASISLAFDSTDDMAGPYLDPLHPQERYAPELLDLFTEVINRDPAYLARLQRHYTMFKEHCEGRRYAGPPFETPGRVKRVATIDPPMPAALRDLAPSAGVPIRRDAKVGRNDPCPCGSGKKYKQCCMLKTSSVPPRVAPAGRPSKALGPAADPAPGAASARDARDLEETARQLIADVRAWRRNPRREGPWGPDVNMALETNHALASPFLRLLLTRYAPDGRRRTLRAGYDECLALLEESLTQIRYAIERQRPWAPAMSDRIQTEMAELALVPEVDSRVQQDLIAALHNAKLPLHPRIRERAAAVAGHYARFGAAGGPPDLDSLLERLLREMPTQDPFELLDPMLAQLDALPPEGQVIAVTGMMDAKQPLWNELAVLFLLHPEAQVRGQLPDRFRHAVGAGHLSLLGLSRLIGLRNWLPAAERPAVDALIKKARMAGIASAPLPAAQPMTVYASPFDGSGAQGVWAFVKVKRHYRILGLLVKQGFGIREVWSQGGLTKRETDAKIRDLAAQGAAVQVDGDYLPLVAAHFIAVGLERDTPPPPQLVELNETVGGDYWKPRSVATAEEIAALIEADPEAFAPMRVAQVMEAARHWVQDLDLAVSWFEDDASVDNLLRAEVGPPEDWLARLPVAIGAIVSGILEHKRGVWAERLIWTALWARAAQGRTPVPWQDFLIVARALQQDTPLAQVPLMGSIALRTVQSAWRRARA